VSSTKLSVSTKAITIGSQLRCELGLAEASALAYLLLGLADSLPLLVAAVALAGLAGATLATAQAYIADVTPHEDRGRGRGLVGAAFGLGLVTGPALGGLLSLYSLEAPAFAAAALTLTNAVFGFFVLPESLQAGRRTRIPAAPSQPGLAARGRAEDGEHPGAAGRGLLAESVLCGVSDVQNAPVTWVPPGMIVASSRSIR